MDFQDVTFKRDHHNAILNALRTLDGDFLLESKRFFGGGTAITLDLGEYRESIDIDLKCSDVAGYRALRAALDGQNNLNRILREGSFKDQVTAVNPCSPNTPDNLSFPLCPSSNYW
ncbi:nucleotidyl transferase AbiEii/AbiGii toxin family protein [Loktanella salsilacus]|uniref:nucleotidyl transferase AbiEii/AbiGii toxin family protein n=1 Tax=Loktanella salsilacus TaxID=195913 RepID=UPI00373511C3